MSERFYVVVLGLMRQFLLALLLSKLVLVHCLVQIFVILNKLDYLKVHFDQAPIGLRREVVRGGNGRLDCRKG